VAARRYGRQTRLPEIGRAGQARLEAAEIALRTRGEAAWIERSYLEAAGAGRVAPMEDGAAEHALPFEVRDPAAREIARGAHAALASLRRVWLGGGEGGPP
jgi:hypothetical protein